MRLSTAINIANRIVALAIIIFLFAGGYLSIFSDVRVTVDNSSGTWIFSLYVFLLVLGLCSFSCLYFLNKSNFSDVRKNWKHTLFLVLPIVFAGWLAAATFGGLPKVLHHFYASNGVIELTVIKMESVAYKGRCAPRVEVKEVTFFIKKHICLSESVYGNLELGSKIRVFGQISPFGIEVAAIEN
ncbi:MAG: hypothetical protein KKE30_06735 [Gammaproteobacteria bacterium]|nr:hypothetical protein [Gammaproteobacteria bacterium]MBU1557023.1 hypothetical protein [Gammaproteobacteria bacterium]MBU2070952.1 hypothetical protein [Gammaproteobacteria bacterium]MBU2181540.1 hypothetical protein [Gammaproteobacteria bacterium]MBU2204882.1 hypothetical protein [Gammaproteobacteria bacterium]